MGTVVFVTSRADMAWSGEEEEEQGPLTREEERKRKVQESKNTKKKKKATRENRHRYLGFNERLEAVQVDVLRRTGRDEGRSTASLLDEELREENGSHFEQQIGKWGELNLTDDFTAFLNQVTPLVGSLPLLLHNKNGVVEAIISHLSKEESKAIKPLCACLSALARDLRHEMYPFFKQLVVPCLVGLLQTTDAEQLEDVFSCFAYIFKFLLRYVVDDFFDLFDSLFPVLSNRFWYIRR